MNKYSRNPRTIAYTTAFTAALIGTLFLLTPLKIVGILILLATAAGLIYHLLKTPPKTQ